MEEKNGRIVGIVESTEVQKQQKKNKRSLRIMIASLILAGTIGYGAMNQSQTVKTDTSEETISTLTDMGMSEEEALEKVRAAEATAAQKVGAITEERPTVETDSREEAISTLTSMGMSREEALEKIRAAEEQAAREKGAITEEVAKELQHPSSGQQETVQPNQPSFPSIQSPVFDERQQFLDKINQKITEMNQMLDNTDVNEQSVSEGKTR